MEFSHSFSKLVACQLPVLHVYTLEFRLDGIEKCFLVVCDLIEAIKVAFTFVGVVFARHDIEWNVVYFPFLSHGAHFGTGS